MSSEQMRASRIMEAKSDGKHDKETTKSLRAIEGKGFEHSY